MAATRVSIRHITFAALSTIAVSFSLVSGAEARRAPLEEPGSGDAFDPTTVVVRATSEEERIALALESARVGRFAEALKRLRDGASNDRVDREITRLERLQSMRSKALEKLAATKTRVTLRHDGKAVIGTIESVDGDAVAMKDYRGNAVELPVDALDPGSLATLVGKKKLDVDDDWVTAYANLISEKEDGIVLARRALSKDSRPDAKALADELEAYTGYRVAAARLVAVREIFAAGLPNDAKAGNAWLVSIEAILEKGADDAVVVRHRDDLRRCARIALDTQFASQGLAALGLKGSVDRDGEALVVKYDGGEPKTIDDFEDAANYLGELRAPFGELPDVSEPKCEATDRGWLLLGRGCRRHRLELEAPLSVDFEIEYGYEEHMQPGPIEIRIGICDDGEGSYISSSNAGDLLAFDRVEGRAAPVRSPLESIQTDLAYALRIEHDGENVLVIDTVDNAELARVPAGRMTSGHLFVWYHTNVPTFIRKLEIRGRVDEARLEELRESWVAERLAAMFGS